MANARSSPELGGPLTALYKLGVAGTLTDGQLLERFLARTDPAASEASFTALVDRHGAMVLSVCREHLGDSHDAHDAFQATFLILVTKARSIRRREAVGGWLFRIARRVATRAQIEAAQRRRQLQQLAEKAPVSNADVEPGTALPATTDYGPLIAEVDRLPEQLRSPVVLHYLEGLSTEATAQRLGCPRYRAVTSLSGAEPDQGATRGPGSLIHGAPPSRRGSDPLDSTSIPTGRAGADDREGRRRAGLGGRDDRQRRPRDGCRAVARRRPCRPADEGPRSPP